MKLRRTMCLVSVTALALTGCSTSYVPRPSPRVALAMQDGSMTYLRDGRAYPGGGFGGDLDEAVAGNPEALSHAKAYRAQMIGGFAATMGGLASMIAGGLVYSNSEDASGRRDPTEQTVGITLGIGGLAAYVTGLVLLTTAQPHLWDAINIYNDSVYDPGVQPRPYGPSAPPPGSPTAPAPQPPGVTAPGTAPPGANVPAAPSNTDPNAPTTPPITPIFR